MDSFLLEKLAVNAAQRRIHDFFRDFDKLGLKRIHPDQGIRALSSCGIPLTKDEQNVIKLTYTGADGMFHYEQLEEDINNVPTNGFFETKPTIDPSSTSPFKKWNLTGTSSATASALMPKAPLATNETAAVEEILSRAQFEASSRGIQLAQYVKQYDTSHRGVVTKTRFVREFLNCFSRNITPADAELLAKAYASSDGQVMYLACARDIAAGSLHVDYRTALNNSQLNDLPSSASLRQAVSSARASSPNARLYQSLTTARTSDDEVTQLLGQIVRHVYERRLRTKEIFVDFDKRNNHRITRPQFVRGIGALRLPSVTAAQLEALADRYVDHADPSGNVIAYRRFLEEVENAFTITGLEKSPHKHNETFARSIVTSAPPSEVRAELTVAEKNTLAAALDSIKTAIQRGRLYNAGTGLKDFDSTGEGHITQERFLRVLAMNGMVPETVDERLVLLKYYRGHGQRGQLINYRAFMHDVGLS